MTAAATTVAAAAPAGARPFAPLAWLEDKLGPLTRTQLGLVLTVILLLLYGPDDWFVAAPLAATAIAGLLWRDLTRSPWYWLVVGSLLAGSLYINRLTADNHKYLMTYWVVAVCLTRWADDPDRALRFNARALIGLAFLFATGWKLASPEFLDGGFLEFTMLTDPRFAGFSAWLSDTPVATLEANRQVITQLGTQGGALHAQLQGAPLLADVARGMAWFTVVLEGWIALAFLSPRPGWLSRTRDFALVLFLFTTYAVATVAGFAYLLIAMGLVQSERSSRLAPALYLAAAFAVQLYTMPWSRIADRLFS